MQRLAEKINKEAQATDIKLDDIEACIEDEAKRIDQLHPKDAKANCDAIERELHAAEEVIKSMFNDVQVLRDNRFGQANELLGRRREFVSTLEPEDEELLPGCLPRAPPGVRVDRRLR